MGWHKRLNYHRPEITHTTFVWIRTMGLWIFLELAAGLEFSMLGLLPFYFIQLYLWKQDTHTSIWINIRYYTGGYLTQHYGIAKGSQRSFLQYYCITLSNHLSLNPIWWYVCVCVRAFERLYCKTLTQWWGFLSHLEKLIKTSL